MKCPRCSGNDDRVSDTREVNGGLAIRRRRVCNRCGFRFSTYEEINPDGVVVVKRDGTRQPFDRKKLEQAVRRACGKRPIPSERFRELLDRVVGELKQGEVASDKVAELIMKELYKTDVVAYIRFASVYRKFTDVEQFLAVISEVSEK